MNKSTRLFLIISGIYVLVLTFILLPQPVSGISPTAQEVGLYYLLYLPVWGLAVALFFISRRIFERNHAKATHIKKGLTYAILFLGLVGFLMNYDYQRQVGCFIVGEHGFSLVKVVVSVCSITLIFLGYYLSNHRLGVSFEFLGRVNMFNQQIDHSQLNRETEYFSKIYLLRSFYLLFLQTLTYYCAANPISES